MEESWHLVLNLALYVFVPTVFPFSALGGRTDGCGQRDQLGNCEKPILCGV